jgi:DeoR family transcriptional regulator, aga operon transcriptional repressor
MAKVTIMPVAGTHRSRTEVRRSSIADAVETRGFVPVTEISATYGVSTVTARADLDALESRGLLRRIRGGAMAAGPRAVSERPFEETRMEAAEAKVAIAAEAVSLLRPGMSVLLDVGTTTSCLAEELLRREDLHDITVITSGLSIALALEPAVPRLQVIVTGGTLRPLQHSLVAPLATVMFEHIRADIAFIGCNGVDALAGITNVNLPEAEVKRLMIRTASHVVVVADGSKLGQVHLGRVAPAAQVDTIITDADAPADALEELRALDGPKIIVAAGPSGRD